MALALAFTDIEREQLGILVNNICVFATQLIRLDGTGVEGRAGANLFKVSREHEDFLRRLDELAREHGEEPTLRLIEDLTRTPSDVAQILTLVRRCLAASAFLGHLIAQRSQPSIAVHAMTQEARLH